MQSNFSVYCLSFITPEGGAGAGASNVFTAAAPDPDTILGGPDPQA